MTNEAIDETDVISRDDYDLALEDGVEDESLLEEPGIKTFSITSYGADYTVDSLVILLSTPAETQ